LFFNAGGVDMEKEVLNKILDRLDKIDSKIGNMENKISSMESKIGSMESKIGSMESKIGSMESKIGSMELKIGSMESKIDILDKDVKTIKGDVVELKVGQSRLENKLNEFEAKNANNHIETKKDLININESLDYLTHKEHQTEKDVYTIKKRLEVIK
jgi:chromosome segregation ATPase